MTERTTDETTEREGPRTYQSAWQHKPDGTATLLTAEGWLEEEAYVDAQLNAIDDADDGGPSRAGTMRAIAAEIRTLRRERSQWAEQATQLIAAVTHAQSQADAAQHAAVALNAVDAQ